MFKQTIPILLIFLATLQISETEKCFLRVIKEIPHDQAVSQTHDFDRDEKMLKTIALDYTLLDENVQKQLHECGSSVASDSCETQFGKEQCEQCGLGSVPKCEHGFHRFDCGLCFKDCPVSAPSIAGGSLCKKNKNTFRTIYEHKEKCLESSKECQFYEDVYASDCPVGYRSLGKTMCTCDCGNGFIDTPFHCQPERMENDQYFMFKYEHNVKQNVFGYEE